MSTLRVRQALEVALGTWAAAQAPAMSVAWESVPFAPPSGIAYCRAFLMPGRTVSRGLDGRHRGYIGLFQIDLYLPAGAGPGAALALCDALDAVFTPAAPLANGGLRIFIVSPITPGPARQDADWYVLPVSCGYQADVIL